MKHLRRSLLFIFVLVLSFTVVNAQDDPVSGLFVQGAEYGTLIDDGESITLSLFDVAEFVPFLFSAPRLNAGRALSASFYGDWGAAEELVGTGLLETEPATIFLALSAPSYDPVAGTLSFDVTIDDIILSDPDSKDDEAPEEFDEATLFITIDSLFIAGLTEGQSLRDAALREATDQTNWASYCGC